MKRRYKLFDGVVLTRDLDDSSDAALMPGVFIPSGTHGVVMELLIKDGIAVEFFDDDGETIDVAFISESIVRPPTEEEAEADRVLNERLRQAALHEHV
jgi:hypothetical protein